MDWLSDSALPFGFLMFFGMVYAFIKKRAGHKLASRAFPILGRRMGLAYKVSRYRGGIGTLSGSLEGYRVLVDPDEHRKLSLYFEGAPAVLLRNYIQNQRPPERLARVYSKNKRFDAYFKTRYASDEVSQQIEAYKDWDPLIVTLEKEFRRQLVQCNVTESGMTLVLNFGNPPHIPGGAVERLLRLMVCFAKVIDPKPRASSTRNAPAKEKLPGEERGGAYSAGSR